MSKYIASVTTWTLLQRANHPSEFAGKLMAAPLVVVGGLLLASGVMGHDAAQFAIGALSLGAAALLATATR